MGYKWKKEDVVIMIVALALAPLGVWGYVHFIEAPAKAARGDSAAAVSPKSSALEAGPNGYLRASSISLQEVARNGATYVMIDASNGQRRGTLQILNGFAVETSDKYPDQSDQYSLSSELSDPWTNCLGKEVLVEDPYSGNFKRWNALCKAEGSHSYPSTGYSGGEYRFEQSSGDLYWVSWNQGGTRTNYYLKAL